MNNFDFSNILLNYKKINIKKELIESYCMKIDFPNSFSMIKPELKILLLRFNINERQIPLSSLTITNEGIFFKIDNHLNYILSRYNLSNSKNLQNELKTVLLSLKEIKNKNKLKELYPKLYEEYLQSDTSFRKLYGIPDDKKVPKAVIKRFITREIDNINYLRRISKDNFKDLTSCEKFLSIIDEDKLKLIIASQIMTLSNKEKYQLEAIKYLKEYLIQNATLLQQDYQIKVYNSHQFGLGNYKVFSIKEIYEFYII